MPKKVKILPYPFTWNSPVGKWSVVVASGKSIINALCYSFLGQTLILIVEYCFSTINSECMNDDKLSTCTMIFVSSYLKVLKMIFKIAYFAKDKYKNTRNNSKQDPQMR